MSQKALVTGVAGFLGSHVAGQLQNMGLQVVGVDDLSGGRAENVPVGVTFLHGDLVDTAFLEHLDDVASDVQYVYHLAAYAAEGLSHFIRRFNYCNNIVGSAGVVNFAIRHEVRCLVFTSSIAVYGAGQVPLQESTIPIPEDPYGIAKLAVENDLRAASSHFGLNHVVFRPHNVYGERQNLADRYRNVVGIFMRQALLGQPLPVFGDGLQTRAFSYVADVAPIIARAPFEPRAINECFNIGADKPYTVLELAETIAAEFQTDLNVVHLEPRHEVVHAFADHAKVVDVFGAHASTELVDGIAQMAEWARSTALDDPSRFGAIEIKKRLPHSWL